MRELKSCSNCGEDVHFDAYTLSEPPLTRSPAAVSRLFRCPECQIALTQSEYDDLDEPLPDEEEEEEEDE